MRNQTSQLSDEEFCRMFFDAVLSQEREKLREFFSESAVIEWPCTKERFTPEEYIRANCEYPGEWAGEIVSVLHAGAQTVLISKVWPKDRSASFHCVSVIRTEQNEILSLTEYWSDDGPAPQWRKEMGIGRPIDTL